jgi:[protein]-arginine 3-hydroxylase / protease
MHRQLERIEAPSKHEFRTRYRAPGVPVVITGVASQWPAARLWTPEYLAAQSPDLPVVTEEWPEGERNDAEDWMRNIRYGRTTLGEVVQRMAGAAGPIRSYLAQFPLFQHLPRLRAHIVEPRAYMDVAVLARLPSGLRSLFIREPLLWLGPRGTVTPLHFDDEDNLFVQLRGTKHIILVPPQQSRQLGFPHFDFRSINFSPVDIERPDLERFPALAAIDRWETTLGPGEMLFIPLGWWHYLRATEASISLSFWWRAPARMARLLPYVYPKLRAELTARLGVRALTMPARPEL